MIDYLERLFAQAEGEEDISSSSPARMESAVESLPVSKIGDEEQWQQDAVRRLERALGVPSPGTIRLPEEQPEPLRRPALTREEPEFQPYAFPEAYSFREAGGAQELERRLRRDSRRYDSGFFLY